jgi:SAM-dependent methyltransferase
MTLTHEAVRDIATTIRQHQDAPSDREYSVELQRLVDMLGVLSDEERAGLDEAVDEIQIASKLWLVDELTKVADVRSRQIVVLGAWYGILPLLLNWRVPEPPAHMLCVDIDPAAIHAAERLLGPLFDNVEYRVADAMTFDYAAFRQHPDSIVVNTVCEHLPRFGTWWDSIPLGQLVVLQSNDYFICPDHVNAVHSLEEMKTQAPMSELLFEGALPLLRWHRFMLIGHR